MPEKASLGRSWGAALFGLVFFFAGAVFLFWLVLPTLYTGWQVQSWPAVTGQLTSARLVTNSSSDSTTYKVEGRYRYTVNGQSYENDRIAISGYMADNIGGFQQRLGRQLVQKFSNNVPIKVWYKPSNPADAIINRDIRWGLLAFKMVFVIVFGGLGLGVLIFSIRGKRVEPSPEARERPWLQRKEWQGGVIRSGARSGMTGMWGFAIFWNLISIPVAVVAVPKILASKEYAGLFVLLFPVIGLGLLFWAIRLTLEWQRFGATPLRLDPFPGSVGGDVGGTVQINTPYDPAVVYKVTLSCINSYVSGTGKNRSRSERVKWQEEGYARVQPTGRGIDIEFRFEVPQELPVSEEYSDNYNLWRLMVEADIPGTDLDRMFEIPVYSTGEKSKHLRFTSVQERPSGVAKMTAESLLPLSRSGSSRELVYPMLRKPGRSLLWLVFGGIFAAAGVFLWTEAGKAGFMLYIMSAAFNLVGWGIVLAGVYSAINSRRITFNGKILTSKRFLLGFPVSTTAADYADIMSVEAQQGMQSSSGKKHTIEYKVLAKLPGKNIKLAENLDSSIKRDLVVAFFEKEFR